MNSDINKIVDREIKSIQEQAEKELHSDTSLPVTKDYLTDTLPKEMDYKAGLLLETLINRLMESAQQKIESGSAEVKNRFYKSEFRKNTEQYAKTYRTNYNISDELNHSLDPATIAGIGAGFTTFLFAFAVVWTLRHKHSLVLISGIAAFPLAVLAFAITRNKTRNLSHKTVRNDVMQYLDNSANQIKTWLEAVRVHFEREFSEFCQKNNIK